MLLRSFFLGIVVSGALTANYSAGVDLLYWQSYICRFVYGAQVRGSLSNQTEIDNYVTSHLEPGVHAWIAACWGDIKLRAGYRYVSTTDRERRNDRVVRILGVNWSDMRTTLHLRYQNANIFLNLVDTGCLQLNAMGCWAEIDRTDLLRGRGALSAQIPPTTVGKYDESQSYVAGGVGLDAALSICLWRNLSLLGEARFCAMMGRQRVTTATALSNDNEQFSFLPFRNRLVTPRLGFSALANWRSCWGRAVWSIRGGYEADMYLSVLPVGDKEIAGRERVTHLRALTVGFGGPVLGLGVDF